MPLLFRHYNAAVFPASPASTTPRVATLLGWPTRHASMLQGLFDGKLSTNYLRPGVVAHSASFFHSRAFCV